MAALPRYAGTNIELTKLVPISVTERRCDCKRCFRVGIPLVCGKADCVHSLQGLSIGEGEPIETFVFHWTKAAESIWPGILYVGTSRAKATHNIALEHPFTTGDARKIGSDKRWQEQHSEVCAYLVLICNCSLLAPSPRAHEFTPSVAGTGADRTYPSNSRCAAGIEWLRGRRGIHNRCHMADWLRARTATRQGRPEHTRGGVYGLVGAIALRLAALSISRDKLRDLSIGSLKDVCDTAPLIVKGDI